MKHITLTIILLVTSQLSPAMISAFGTTALFFGLGANQQARDYSPAFKSIQDTLAKTTLYGLTTAIQGAKDLSEYMYEGAVMSYQKYRNTDTTYQREVKSDVEFTSKNILVNPKGEVIDPNDTWSGWGAEKLRKATFGYFTIPERKISKWEQIDINRGNCKNQKNEIFFGKK